jgi:hypothetical protein
MHSHNGFSSIKKKLQKKCKIFLIDKICHNQEHSAYLSLIIFYLFIFFLFLGFVFGIGLLVAMR